MPRDGVCVRRELGEPIQGDTQFAPLRSAEIEKTQKTGGAPGVLPRWQSATKYRG